MTQVVSPRIVLGAAPNPDPPLPASFGGVPIWETCVPVTIGGCQGWEYRHPEYGLSAVIQLVSVQGERATYVAWVPADARDGLNPVFAQLAPVLTSYGVLAGYWECSLVEGELRPVGDLGSLWAEVVANWPPGWRARLEGDDPEGLPSGPMLIGEVIA